jgi:hypothetical protein
MGLLGFIKDVVLLPVDIVQDVTGIGVIKRVIRDDLQKDMEEGLPFDTAKRLKSMGKNWEDTYDE